MEAPDKIYVQCPSSKWIGQLWNEKPLRTKEDNVNYINATNIEYIRKDALLEWAKEQKKATEELIKEHPKDDSLWAEMHWYEQLIKHIESL